MTNVIDVAPEPPPGGANEPQLSQQQDTGILWRPYVDPPLLTPQMVLGLDDTSPAHRQRLSRYLAALVTTRRAPVHINVAFNAVYFGFDLEARSYVGGPLNELFSLPVVQVEAGGDALPVGALVNITTGARPLFAEVVYKEGAHPLLGGDGSLPGGYRASGRRDRARAVRGRGGQRAGRAGAAGADCRRRGRVRRRAIAYGRTVAAGRRAAAAWTPTGMC